MPVKPTAHHVLAAHVDNVRYTQCEKQQKTTYNIQHTTCKIQ